MGGTASERSSGHCARLWTSVGHWRDGKNLERHTSDVGAHMAPLGVETAGRAFYTIKYTTRAMYSERDSPRSPWKHVGRSARSARHGEVSALHIQCSLAHATSRAALQLLPHHARPVHNSTFTRLSTKTRSQGPQDARTAAAWPRIPSYVHDTPSRLAHAVAALQLLPRNVQPSRRSRYGKYMHTTMYGATHA